MTADVRAFATYEALCSAAADDIIRLARETIDQRGICHLAVSGGQTPRRVFEVLAARGGRWWRWVELWWVDERTVPPDHAESNFRMAREALIDAMGIDRGQAHRMRGELSDPEGAARAYQTAMVDALGNPPVLDIVLLGIGADGHTASLFPGSPALDEYARWVVANTVDSPLAGGATTRITLTARTINAARHVRFIVSGEGKAQALAAVLEGPHEPKTYPAQLIQPASGDLAWFVDDAAQSRLEGRA
jgi:6-phosphogluconolactonase